MVAVYSTFGEAEVARPQQGFKKYVAALGAAWITLVVAAVLIVGNDSGSQSVLLSQGRPQMLAFKEFEPEQNVFEKFDDDFKPELKKDYDLEKEADWAQINIASKAGDVKEGIDDPYEDQSPRIKVPDEVYTQDPPYKTEVVEINEHTLGKPFHEYTADEEGEPVMGEDYEDKPFDVTINSVPEKNPSRDWDFLDVDAMAGTPQEKY
uniref:Uncharacterized protein n=2 Tax=Hemiselmis andersenii TaxID=464988 RepID=A0A6U4P1H2_HEMAN|mmetsp:Transcript_15249/g.36963  ORF Transcript_15249/g.36963 Transcript_15249/m.36963 type:complete len:207 (+) Transcript_15249:29-649(+)